MEIKAKEIIEVIRKDFFNLYKSIYKFYSEKKKNSIN